MTDEDDEFLEEARRRREEAEELGTAPFPEDGPDELDLDLLEPEP